MNEGVVFALGPTTVLVTAQLSATLAWIAVSSEEAPDLMASAPISAHEQRRRKLEALAIPLAALALPALAWLTWISPAQGLVVTVFAAAAAVSTALVNIWRPQPGKRAAVLRRYTQSKLIAMVEHLFAILWAMATILYLQEKRAWMVLVAIALVTLWLARPARPRAPRGAAQTRQRSGVAATS